MTVCIIPAAGASTRMGQNKALMLWRDSTVIESLIATLLTAGIARVRVVLRPTATEIANVLEAHERVSVTLNPKPERGMLSSVLCGVRAETADDIPSLAPLLVCPVDHPALTPESVSELLEAGAVSPGRIWVPTYLGKRGHPVLIPSEFRQQLESLDPKRGLRALLEDNPAAVSELAVDDVGVVANLNTPADYERLLP